MGWKLDPTNLALRSAGPKVTRTGDVRRAELTIGPSSGPGWAGTFVTCFQSFAPTCRDAHA